MKIKNFKICNFYFCLLDTDFEYNDEDEPSPAEESSHTAESPPVSPSSTASGPYIPISECITGPPLSSPDSRNHFLALQQQQNRKLNGDAPDFYDAPRMLQPPNLDLRPSGSPTPPLQSPATDGESVFTDEEWTNPHPKPTVNWETFPRPSDSSVEGDNQKPATITVVGKRYTRNLGDFEVPVAPPRPPKPLHLVSSDNGNHSYLNLENMTSGTSTSSTISAPVTNGEVKNNGVNDEMYDFPRSHNLNGEAECVENPVPQGQHCYTNAAPVKVNGDVFRYDFTINPLPLSSQSEPNSPPVSDSSPAVLYSNLPSPATSLTTTQTGSNRSPGMVLSPVVPPTVNRDLKPGRKMSDSASSEASPLPVGIATCQPPPSIDRKLKPTPAVRKKPDHYEEGKFY